MSEQGKTEAVRLLLGIDRPTPEQAAKGTWQEGFDLTQAEARVEFADLQSQLADKDRVIAEQAARIAELEEREESRRQDYLERT